MLNLQSIDLKKEIQELKKLSGEERGVDIKYLVKDLIKKEGKRGFERVKAELKKLDYQLSDIEKIDDMDWVPVSLINIFFVTSVKLFNWQEKDIIEIGKNVISFSSTIKRFFIKYFISPKRTFETGARNWRKFYSFGQTEIDYDGKNKIVAIRLKDFKVHPFTCLYLQGVFSGIVEIATGGKKVTVKETKCMFKGDPYHEFKITWE